MVTKNYDVGCVAAARQGKMPRDPGEKTREKHKIFFAETSRDYAHVSSTKIRQDLKTGKLREN